MLICDFVFSSTVTPKTFDTGTDGTSGAFLFPPAARDFSLAAVAYVDLLISGCTICEKTLNLHLCVLTDNWVKKKKKNSA